MEASVIIPTHNRAEILRQTLEALEGQTFPKERFEVIVVDDGSSDGTEKMMERFLERSRVRTLYFKQKHGGTAAARNFALKNADGGHIIFINDDIIPSEKLVEEHLKTQLKYANKKIAVLGKVEFHQNIKPNIFMKFLEEKNYWMNFPAIENKKILSWDYFWTCNLSIKKEVLGKERFDEGLRRLEDTELGYRLGKGGLKIIYDKEALGFHLHEMTFRKWEKNQKKDILSAILLCQKIFGEKKLIKKMKSWGLAIGFVKKGEIETDLECALKLLRKKAHLLEKRKIVNKADRRKIFGFFETAVNLVILKELSTCCEKLAI